MQAKGQLKSPQPPYLVKKNVKGVWTTEARKMRKMRNKSSFFAPFATFADFVVQSLVSWVVRPTKVSTTRVIKGTQPNLRLSRACSETEMTIIPP